MQVSEIHSVEPSRFPQASRPLLSPQLLPSHPDSHIKLFLAYLSVLSFVVFENVNVYTSVLPFPAQKAEYDRGYSAPGGFPAQYMLEVTACHCVKMFISFLRLLGTLPFGFATVCSASPPSVAITTFLLLLTAHQKSLRLMRRNTRFHH